MIRTTPARRRGFTLVEILVAVAIGIVLLGIAVGVSQSSAFESYKVVGTADRLSQWMLTAKNRALRDRTPRGIRLIPDANNPSLIKEIAYIEQPDPWVPPPGATLTLVYKTNSAGTAVASRQAFLSGTPADLTSFVVGGDALHVPELNWTGKLAASPFTTPNTMIDPAGVTVEVQFAAGSTTALPDLGAAYSPPPGGTATNFQGTYSTTQFGFIRQPRPLLGEPTVQLPSGMAVDLANSLPANPTNLDILFAPSEEVIGNADGVTALLLRDSNLPGVNNPRTTDYARAGQMILVCLYGRTGAISTQPVAPPPTDSFQFARDAVNTGL